MTDLLTANNSINAITATTKFDQTLIYTYEVYVEPSNINSGMYGLLISLLVNYNLLINAIYLLTQLTL